MRERLLRSGGFAEEAGKPQPDLRLLQEEGRRVEEVHQMPESRLLQPVS